MGDSASWIDIASVVTAIGSMTTALVALGLAIRSDRRSRQALVVQTYLQLRSGFLEIYRDLGVLSEADSNSEELRLTRQAYWHHAWDEWYVAKRLAPSEFAGLWDDFFASAVHSGYQHPALRASLEELVTRTDAGFGAYADDLVAELRRMESVRDRVR